MKEYFKHISETSKKSELILAILAVGMFLVGMYQFIINGYDMGILLFLISTVLGFISMFLHYQ